MATTALSTLLPLMSVPRCAEAIQLRALRLACRRFCDDTGAWTEDLTSFVTVADQADYTLSPDYDDVAIRRVTNVELDEADLGEDQWSLSPGGVLTFDSAPDEADLAVVVTVVYVPQSVCTLVVDWLLSRWAVPIAAGAEAHLKRDPGKTDDPVPWFDLTSAAIAEQRYRDGVGEAKLEVFSARQSGHVGIEQRDFYL